MLGPLFWYVTGNNNIILSGHISEFHSYYFQLQFPVLTNSTPAILTVKLYYLQIPYFVIWSAFLQYPVLANSTLHIHVLFPVPAISITCQFIQPSWTCAVALMSNAVCSHNDFFMGVNHVSLGTMLMLNPKLKKKLQWITLNCFNIIASSLAAFTYILFVFLWV